MAWSVFAVLATVKMFLCSRDGAADSYEEFREQYNRTGIGQDGVDDGERRALFDSRLAAVREHNAKPDINWFAAVNEFADYTDKEFSAMLGYRASSRRTSNSAPASSFLQAQPSKVLAKSVDWRTSTTRSHSFQRDQGACGSCWAVAAVGALEMHAELRDGYTHPLSFEQLVDCVPNPQHCGGEGGCKGATAEEAFKYVQSYGLDAADQYTGYLTNKKAGQCKQPAPRSTALGSFEVLPTNKLQNLMEALATHGPVVASVAGKEWSMYKRGVFDGCKQDAVVSHAVVMVGYGEDNTFKKIRNSWVKQDYFLIRNSWGPKWGEGGYIRLQRHLSDQGDAGYCGTDHDPQAGYGCDGGPSTLRVCGMCGVLSDSVLPKSVRIDPSMS